MYKFRLKNLNPVNRAPGGAACDNGGNRLQKAKFKVTFRIKENKNQVNSSKQKHK